MRKAMGPVLLSLLLAAGLCGQQARAVSGVRSPENGLLVELDTSNEIVDRGDHMRVWVQTTKNAHVTVLRIDTEGRVRMLFPERPWHNNYVEGGERLEVGNSGCGEDVCAFAIDDYPGQGFVFAIASSAPLDLDSYSRGDYWDYSRIAQHGKVTGDPFVAFSDLLNGLVADSGEGESSYDVRDYHVEGKYEYPRFLCYECHSYVRYLSWNPYEQCCSRFRVVRYDEPEYYPVGQYGSERTVYARPRTLDARYVFQDRDADEPFVSIANRRSRVEGDEQPRMRGATAQDFGGVGSVPAPLRRRAAQPDSSMSLDKPQETVVRVDTPSVRQQPRLLRRLPETEVEPRRKPPALLPDTQAGPDPGLRIVPANPVRPLPALGPRERVKITPRAIRQLRRNKPDSSGSPRSMRPR